MNFLYKFEFQYVRGTTTYTLRGFPRRRCFHSNKGKCLFPDSYSFAYIQDAFLLIGKSPQSMYAVENMDFVIEYGIFNTGDRAAKKVILNDQRGFPTQAFEIVKGLLNVRFETIPPGGNVTHSVIVSFNSIIFKMKFSGPSPFLRSLQPHHG